MTSPQRRGILLHHPVVIAPGEPTLEVAGVVRSSAVDGPGNRHVIFLQGCNFDCTACHNPSTIGRCDACGACVPACPHGALSFPEAGAIAFDAAACDRCRACIAVCPIDADPAIRVVPVSILVDEIRTGAAFISGITVSGGEPTMQFDGLLALFTALRADPVLKSLTTLVDSNGTLPVPRWNQLLPVLDGAMIDLKAGTEELHRRLTGHGSDPVRESIRFLADAGKLSELRLLVVEGVTDTPDELASWAGFVTEAAPGVPVRLMAFRHQGTRQSARAWPETTPEAVADAARRLEDLGIRSWVADGTSQLAGGD